MSSFTPDNLAFDKLLVDIMHLQFPEHQIPESFNDYTRSDDAIVMRSNYKYGTRCPQCGLMIGKILKVPSVRTCKGCRNCYEISQEGRGIKFVIRK